MLIHKDLYPTTVNQKFTTTSSVNYFRKPITESSDNSDDPTNPSGKPSRNTPLPLSYTKRTQRIPKMTRFKFFPKRKRSFDQQTNNSNTTSNTSLLPNFTLPQYSTVNPHSHDYSFNTTSVNDENYNPVKVYLKTNYPFTPPSF